MLPVHCMQQCILLCLYFICCKRTCRPRGLLCMCILTLPLELRLMINFWSQVCSYFTNRTKCAFRTPSEERPPQFLPVLGFEPVSPFSFKGSVTVNAWAHNLWEKNLSSKGITLYVYSHKYHYTPLGFYKWQLCPMAVSFLTIPSIYFWTLQRDFVQKVWWTYWWFGSWYQ